MMNSHFNLLLGLVCLLCNPSASTVLTELSPCPNNFFYSALYDLESKSVCPSPHVTEYRPIVIDNSCKCCSRGTLNITLNDRDRKALLVDLWFDSAIISKKFAFNLGDSKTNNGYRGDSMTTNYDAEIHNTDETSFTIFSSDKGAAEGEPDQTTVANAFSSRLTFIIKAGSVQWVSDTALDYLKQEGLFTFNGPDDLEAAGGRADYSVFLGLNQVVNGQSSRRGQGLCKAAVRFLCEGEGVQSECGGKPIDEKTHICCDGKIYKRKKNRECCGKKLYPTKSKKCCPGGRIVKKQIGCK